MKNPTRFYPFALAVLLFSCQSVYLPNARNVPMLSKAGEVQGNLSFLSGYNLQAAVAVTDHLAVMGNGMYGNSTKMFDDAFNDRRTKYTFGEIGAGYFKNGPKFYFDMFGGYGVGRSSSNDSSFTFSASNISLPNLHVSTVNYHRYFVQGSIGLRRKHFEAALAYRFSLIDIANGIRNGSTVDVHQSPVLFIEPAAVMRIPIENFVLHAQLGFSKPMNSFDLLYEYVPITISTGIGFRFGHKHIE